MSGNTSSEETTDGIVIRVTSMYLPKQSSSARYVFGYRVQILNTGVETVTLRTRHWVITNGEGSVEEVRGPGVVGEQPTLATGDAFEYSSGAILSTPWGTMHGSYQFERGSEIVDAKIGEFRLEKPYSLN